MADPIPPPLPKICDAARAADLLRGLAAGPASSPAGGKPAEFAVVRNPAYIHPPYELYPLAPCPALPLRDLRAVVCDMDGTTTTTEPLCLHALETMVRRVTGRLDKRTWPGLSRERDYPHVIGNSTTKHIEYLWETYGGAARPECYAQALVESAGWTIETGQDDLRREEARAALAHFGLGESGWAGSVTNFKMPGGADAVRGAIEIYYARYHQILAEIAAGRGVEMGKKIFGGTDGAGQDTRLIRPMPGVEVFLAMIKGLLSADETGAVFDAVVPGIRFHGHGSKGAPEYGTAAQRAHFMNAAARFTASPIKIAVVTSSIRHEAEIVLGELFNQLRATVTAWPVSAATRARLAEKFASPAAYYDAIITASDSSEIRLKPHRDLYSIALHRLGIAPADFDCVLGLEDSESGLLAIRAAGVGLAVAVPFADTLGHDLSAAAKINHGGLWEVMLEDRFFVG